MSETTVHEVEIAASSVKGDAPTKSVTEAVLNGKKTENGNHIEASPKKSTVNGNDSVKTATQLLATGKRNLLVNDLNSAVASLAEACEMLAKQYGETSEECGEAYFLYGKALLELARLEAGVIDNGLDGVPSEDDDGETSQIEDPEKCTDEERETVAKEVDAALEENFSELEKARSVNGTNGKSDSEPSGDVEMSDGTKPENEKGAEDEEDGDSAAEVDDESEVKDEDEPANGSSEAGPSSSKDDKDPGADEEEDPSNLQLSWEMLELAKNIFTKQIESIGEGNVELRSDLESKLSETFQLLGEVSIENEDYKQAVDDLTTCLKRRQKNLPEDSRVIAETHYQLGVALGFNAQYDEAVNALNDAIGVLQKRVDNLKEEKESKDPVKANESNYTREKEIAEIEGLIPEIREKISDTNDMKSETAKKLDGKEATEETSKPDAATETSAANQTGDNCKATSSIDHLVKKRKKDEPAPEVADAKKPHVESNGHTNGN